jgi:hypothetical protein
VDYALYCERTRNDILKKSLQKSIGSLQATNIIMRPGTRKFEDDVIEHLVNCPVSKADIRAAEDIFGRDLGSLKEKPVRQSISQVMADVDAIPEEVLRVGQDVTVAIDIMFVNKIPFFIALSREIKFGTVESVPNSQVTTIHKCLQRVVDLYAARGVIVKLILADGELEPLCQWFPMLNTTAANEHVPDIEQYIHTVKEQTRSTYTMLLYCHLPQIALLHLVKNAVFWLNTFLKNDGVSKKYSPQYIMTGQQLSYNTHAVIEFGSYVQTHEEHSNNMDQRTMGCICLGPTGNQQGRHWFMSLASGECVS